MHFQSTYFCGAGAARPLDARPRMRPATAKILIRMMLMRRVSVVGILSDEEVEGEEKGLIKRVRSVGDTERKRMWRWKREGDEKKSRCRCRLIEEEEEKRERNKSFEVELFVRVCWLFVWDAWKKALEGRRATTSTAAPHTHHPQRRSHLQCYVRHRPSRCKAPHLLAMFHTQMPCTSALVGNSSSSKSNDTTGWREGLLALMHCGILSLPYGSCRNMVSERRGIYVCSESRISGSSILNLVLIHYRSWISPVVLPLVC